MDDALGGAGRRGKLHQSDAASDKAIARRSEAGRCEWRSDRDMAHPISENDADDVIAQLGLTNLAGARDDEPGPIDEWPKQRRRSVVGLSNEAKKAFVDSAEVRDYRERLNV